MEKKLQTLVKTAQKEFKQATTEVDLEDLHTKYLGRKNGQLTNILRDLKNLSLDEKKIIGPLANKIKQDLESQFVVIRKKLLRDQINLDKEWLDVSFPGTSSQTLGRLHPITQIQNEVEDLFKSMGFLVLDGPELESDYYNFTSLNTPPHHPARDMQDTFWLDDGNLMRTQTSSVQVRAMEEYGVPLKAIVPGRTFRAEELDASHGHTFYQVEGIMVDKNISIANLIAVMKEVIHRIFNKDTVIRLRPGYFPFVEPAFELDIQCLICNGSGCSTCKQVGWIELMPCGMVHPRVLEFGDVDPKEYQGFAFAIGFDRLVMMRYGINDIRYLLKNDLRFLNQF